VHLDVADRFVFRPEIRGEEEVSLMAVKTEGGMAATSNPLLAERMRRCPSTACPATRGIAMAELASWIINVAPGPEYNLTGISAALEVHQLRRANRDAKVRERLHAATPYFGLLPKSGGQLARRSIACLELGFDSSQS